MVSLKHTGLVLLAVLWLPLQCLVLKGEAAPFFDSRATQSSVLTAAESEPAAECYAGRFSSFRTRQEGVSECTSSVVSWRLNEEANLTEARALDRFPLPFVQNWCLLRHLALPIRAPSSRL
jgi:hypothetical protein